MTATNHLWFETDDGIGTTASLGLIVLEADETIEHEFAQIIPEPDVAIYHSRIPMRPEITPETLAEMEADLPVAAALLPVAERLDVIGYGCTSGATIIGSDKVAAAIDSVRPGVKVTDPIDSLVAACVALRAEKVAFLTPYTPEVSSSLRNHLERSGLGIVAFGSFQEADDRVVARISPSSILSAIISVAGESDCDAVVVSCTNLRVAGIAEEAEKILDRPVISSNTALAWNMLRLAGADTARAGYGRLFNWAKGPN